ncbi:MAG: SDR family oxidoreductase [Bacteroidales bacterium]|nr:SDR family oxidoreductase [Bacteroidales bacterium]
MKNILITGTSSGFGQVIANHLSKVGFNVIGTSRKTSKIISEYEMIELDVTKDESVNEALKTFIEKMGTIDILINNAGYGIAGAIEDTSIMEAKEQFETNFFGVVRMTKAVLPLMRKQNSGLILNISSIGGLIGLPFQGFYSASKFALEGYVEALRMEIKQFNIQVVNINPGDYKTTFTANRNLIINQNNVYKASFDKTLKIYENDEQNGSNPIEIAFFVEKLIKKRKSYRVRYIIGKPLQVLGVYLKKYLNSRIFEKILILIYK